MKSFRALARYLRPYWLPALIAPLLMALEVAMDLAQPRLLQTIVDVGIAQHDLDLVVRVGIRMIGVALVGVVGGVGCTIFATLAAHNFGADVRDELFRKVQDLACSDLDRLETGRLVTRLTNDVDQVQEAMAMFLRILVRAPLLVVGSLIMAVLTSPTLSLLIVALCPLVVITFLVLTGRVHAFFLAIQERLDQVNIVMQENLAGIRVIKAFVRSRQESARFGKANDALMAAASRAAYVVAGMSPFLMLLVSLGVVGVLWWGGHLARAGEVHVGQILAFINYLTQMLSSLMMVGMLAMQVTRANASAERILEVLDTTPRIQDDAEPVPLPSVVRGRVEFSHVGFRYDGEDSEPVLRDFSFVAEPGETVAIMGATGSGKSTLVHLIARLYEVTAGRILIDGVDVRRLRQEDLRQLVAMVPQNTVLFSGTIADNIRFGNPTASDAAVEEAARLAQAHSFIEALPDGFQTRLGQRGTSLSGGQKQRLAIARALVCKPRILILDDCTSAVDGATEMKILRGLRDWEHSCTRLVVAQRIGAVVAADRILVLEDGALAASGTHAELLRVSPLYQEIARSQWDGIEVPGV